MMRCGRRRAEYRTPAQLNADNPWHVLKQVNTPCLAMPRACGLAGEGGSGPFRGPRGAGALSRVWRRAINVVSITTH